MARFAITGEHPRVAFPSLFTACKIEIPDKNEYILTLDLGITETGFDTLDLRLAALTKKHVMLNSRASRELSKL